MTVLFGRARERVCRGCGCTDSCACIGGCTWVLLDVGQQSGICSACAINEGWDPVWMACIGFDDEEEAA